LGISCPTVKYEAALYIAGLTKKNFPEVTVVFGGCHPTALPEQVLANEQVDYVVRGEGELTTADLLAALDKNTAKDNIAGLSYKKDGKIIHNTDRDLISNLDDLPYPGRELLLNDTAIQRKTWGC